MLVDVYVDPDGRLFLVASGRPPAGLGDCDLIGTGFLNMNNVQPGMEMYVIGRSENAGD